MHIVDLVIAVVWVAVLVYWLVAASAVKASRPNGRRWTMFLGVRIVVIAAVLILVRSRVGEGHLNATVDPWLQGIGLVIFLAGTAMAVWARAILGRNWGQPMSQRIEPELVTGGPYRYVRHPIYSGLLLAMIGTTIAVSLYWLVALVILGAYFVYSATVEERLMEAEFPDAYPEYRRRTKMLMPFVF